MQSYELQEHTRLMGEAEAAEQSGEATAARSLFKRAAQHGLAAAARELGPETQRVVLQNVRRAVAGCKAAQAGQAASSPPAATGSAPVSEVPSESWADVLGLERTRERITLSTCLARRQQRLMSELGGAAERSFLLYGPPGGGKSMIARAVANELACPFYEIAASTVLGMYLGQSESALRKYFDAAAAQPLSILFIDEIDGLAPSRQREQSSESAKRLVTELLQCLDRVKRSGGVYVFGATNLKSSIDSAVLRRFESRICLPLPGARVRESLLLRHLPWLRDAPERLAAVVARTAGFNASDLLGVLNRVKSEPLRLAHQSRHWRKTSAGLWAACGANEDGAVAMHAREVPVDGMWLRQVTPADLDLVLSTAESSVRLDEVERIYAEAGAELLDRE